MVYNYKQDELIKVIKFDAVDASYPLYLAGWELRKVSGMKYRYARLIFKKLSNLAEEFTFKYSCIDDFGSVISTNERTLRNLKIQPTSFGVFVPATEDAVAIGVSIVACKLSNGELIENTESVIIRDTFKPFADEQDGSIAKSLVSSALGYPTEGETVWTCACGEINSKSNTECIYCHTNKTEVFEKITADNVRQKKEEIQEENRLRKERALIKKKRIIRVLAITMPIILAILAVVISLSVHYAMTMPLDNLEEDGIVYKKLDDGTYQVVDFIKNNIDEVNIPSTVRGVKVTSIKENAFAGCDSLTSVTIPDSVSTIGNSAFYDCDSLTSVTFENPNGWKAENTLLSSTDLANASTATTYLKSTYFNYIWTRT